MVKFEAKIQIQSGITLEYPVTIQVIDNFDSFTYNLVHYLEEMCREVKVTGYQALSGNSIQEVDGILIGPGPGHPSEYPELNRIIGESCGKVPVLGVCLGHQLICSHFGASCKNLKQVWHGIERKTIVVDKQDPLFRSVPDTFMSGRYHSWAVSGENFPESLKITATDEDGTIMSVKHTLYNIWGIQFHPESIMTPHGKTILRNWIETIRPLR